MISVIIPILNESNNIKELYNKLRQVLKDKEFEIIFVNDGSTDNSIDIIKTLDDVRYIDLSRNFGKEIAITCGINRCLGDIAIILDADMEHPVELIPRFIEEYENGYDIVIGVKNDTNQTLFRRFLSYLFYRVIRSISKTKIIPNETDFRLLTRKIIKNFKKLNEQTRLTRGLINWLGFEKKYIYFDPGLRKDTNKYKLGSLFNLALNSFTSLSLLPLKIAGILGIFITLFSSMLWIIVFLNRYIYQNNFFSGTAILAIFLMFLVGIILICIGILAIYIGNIYEEVKNRPLYIIKDEK